jgi:hypothetical protein
MSKKQSTHTVVVKNTNSSSPTQSKNSNKRNRKKNNNKMKPMGGPVVNISVASSRRLVAQKPVTRNISNGINVRHTELIGVVSHPVIVVSGNSSQSPLVTAFRLRCNPGSKKTFNWLSSLAPNFENYRFRSLKFYYETRSSTTTPGSIIISPDYDAADGQIAVTEQTLFNNKGSVDDAVWKHIECPLVPASMNRLYKSHVNMSDERFNTSAQDEKTIDCAQVFCCIDPGTNAATRYGKLFVIYDVDLTEPQAPTDPDNLGGASTQTTNVSAGLYGPSGSSKPILNSNVIQSANSKSDVGLFTFLPDLTEIPVPTATVGQFARDFVGDLILKRVGTGLSTSNAFYIGTDPLTDAGTGTDLPVPNSTTFGGVTNTALTDNITIKNVAAKAGEYLKMTAGVYTTMGQLAIQLAGVGTAGQII